MSGILGRKRGMSRTYSKSGGVIPYTVIEAIPCVVTQIKKIESDGYLSVQLSQEEKKEKKTTKSLKGHFSAANTTPKYRTLEVRDFSKEVVLGDRVELGSIFSEGDKVKISGKSKGKGFAGVMKRHGFHGVGDATHGQKNRKRAPGSIGAGSSPSRVIKGMKMAGRMGGKRTTIPNLEVIKVISEHNLLIVKGAVPGPKNGKLLIKKTK